MKIVQVIEVINMKRKKIDKYLKKEVITYLINSDLANLESSILEDSTINEQVNKEGRTLLHLAVIYEKNDITELLIKMGANVNVRDNLGWAPLHYSVQSKLINVTTLLTDRGADLEIRDNYGNTPLWRATFSSQGKGELITLLIDKGASVDNENDSGISPIRLAHTIANYDVKQFF